MATDTGTGLKPALIAAVMARGPIMLVAAVCEVSSDNNNAITANTAMRISWLLLPPMMAKKVQSAKLLLSDEKKTYLIDFHSILYK